MTHNYLLIAALPSSPAPYWTYLKSPQKNFLCRLYNFLCLKLRGNWTESHQISIGCTEIIADYSAKTKSVIFQSVWKHKCNEWRSSSNCGRIAAKIVRFNSVNSEITGWKFIKFGHDVTWLLPLKCLKVDLWSANQLSNAKAKSKFVPCNICDHLSYFTGCHSNVPWATAKQIFGKSSPLMRLPNL